MCTYGISDASRQIGLLVNTLKKKRDSKIGVAGIRVIISTRMEPKFGCCFCPIDLNMYYMVIILLVRDVCVFVFLRKSTSIVFHGGRLLASDDVGKGPRRFCPCSARQRTVGRD